MSKNTKIVIIIVIIIVLGAGGYAIFHKSNKNNANSSPSNNTSTSQSSLPDINNSVVITKTNPALGKYLADPQGKALYTYNADSSGASNCSGSCLTIWPAYQDKGSTTGLPAGIGTIKRADNGQIQYTFNGMPLYYFASDSGTQVTGNGVQNFSVARPATPQASGNSATPSSSTSNSSSSGSNSGYPY